MSIRHLEPNDYDRGFMELINVFTRNIIPKTKSEFVDAFNIITKQNGHVYVIEMDSKIVATAKLVIEQKFHNNFRCMGHIEDLVTHPEYRHKGYASLLLAHILQEAKMQNCYKITLCSSNDNAPVYLKNGFLQRGIEFVQYL